jgi:phospholipid/cholesterol/gamma-HCH transport system permease protein
MAPTTARIDDRTDGLVVSLTGAVVISALASLERTLASLPRRDRVVIDLSAVEAMDTGGAWLIATLSGKLEREGIAIELIGGSGSQMDLIATVAKNLPMDSGADSPARGILPWLDRLGRQVAGGALGMVDFLGFVGLVVARLGNTVLLRVQNRRLLPKRPFQFQRH